MESLIKLKNLNFTYNKGKDNEYQALVNITFEIFPQEFIILFGPSGCGKSTLLNIIAGLEVPVEGTAFVYGKDMAKINRSDFTNYHRKQVGMIYQAYNLITSLSVLDNVALPQIFLNKRKKNREEIGMDLLERFGIKPQAKKLPSELSGGQQQRIGIARAIVNNPELILADEPVGNLDSVSAKNVLGILKDLNEKEKKTVILVTHNPEYLSYGDRIMHMKDGIIIKETINEDKNKIKTKEDLIKAPTNGLQELMRTYSGLTPEQINILIMPYKAKVFAHHFITSRNIEETKIFEDLMQRRLMNQVEKSDFYKTLNLPYEEGGVGFDKRTAEKLAQTIDRNIKMAHYMGQIYRQRRDENGGHIEVPIEEKAKNIAGYLVFMCFKDYKNDVSEIVFNRIERAVLDRITDKTIKTDFYSFLDKPFKEGGAGLNSKTARAVTELLELILILSFGIAQNKRLEKRMRKNEENSQSKMQRSQNNNEAVPNLVERPK